MSLARCVKGTCMKNEGVELVKKFVNKLKTIISNDDILEHVLKELVDYLDDASTFYYVGKWFIGKDAMTSLMQGIAEGIHDGKLLSSWRDFHDFTAY